MPKNIAAVDSFQITLTRTLIEHLEILAGTGMYGAQLQDVIEDILSQEIRRLRAGGEFAELQKVRSYPASNKGGEDGNKKESKESG
jgi:hypothetical protein